MLTGSIGPARVLAKAPTQLKATTALVGTPSEALPALQAARKKMAEFGARKPSDKNLAPTQRHVAGVRGQGPSMLRKPVHPKQAPLDPRAMSTAYRQLHGIRLPQPSATPKAPLPGRGVQSTSPLTSSGARVVPSGTRRTMTINPATPSYTGINHWWTYEEDAIAGIGKYMVNVGQGGNLIVQADDMAIPHKGIELAFRRTYNSLSGHDYYASDGAQTISNYGANWTNTLDSHLAQNSGNQYGVGLSVFDIDGARYDYMPDGQGHWVPPAGQFATLTFDGVYGYFWTKKSGTVYYFYEPTSDDPNLQQYLAYAGRLYMIFGRNHNTYLQLTYSWTNGIMTCSCTLSDISVAEEDGRSAHLAFSDVSTNPGTQRLLSTLTWPDGTVVSYQYDPDGNLAWVDEPPNSTYSWQCYAMSQCIPQQFTYFSGHRMDNARSPRYVMGAVQNIYENGQFNGELLAFTYDGANALTNVYYVATVNPQPIDGTNTSIQPGYSNWSNFYVSTFTRSSGTTIWADTDGHNATYLFDSAGRVTSTVRSGLITTATWDSQNNLTATTAPSNSQVSPGPETDYAYDGNGNTIAVALPSLTVLFNGGSATFRPTSLYSYDQNNNITAYCDPQSNHPSRNWTSRPSPSDTLCPIQSGATLMNWSSYPTTAQEPVSTPQEPFGELLSMTTPLGYHHSFQYNPSQESPAGGTDYGMPTAATGDAINQSGDQSTPVRTPTQQFTYDAYGDVLTAYNGSGTMTYSYDNSGRLMSVHDADGVVSSRTYYPDGLVSSETGPSQAAGGVSTTFTFDADLNQTSETRHHGCVPGYQCTSGTTAKWYDGADRLVEVKQPQDPADLYSNAWMTRYFYDLTAGHTVSIGADTGLHAYGNLYLTEEFLPGLTYDTSSSVQPFAWTPVKGNTFDDLDRGIASYDLGMNTHAQYANSYDQNGYFGLLSSKANALSPQQTQTFTYDAAQRLATVGFSDSGTTPGRQVTYDANGRVVRVTSDRYGSMLNTYDADGRLTQVIEPTNAPLTAPAVISYGYFEDGVKKSLSVTSSAFSQQFSGGVVTNLFRYAYRSDGKLEQEIINWPGVNAPYTFSYTAAGRATSVSDPLTGTVPNGGWYAWQSMTVSYDSYGRPSSLNTPAGGGGQNLTYDEEGSLVYSTGGPYSGTGGYDSNTNSYNVRGELRAQRVGLGLPVWNGTSCGVVTWPHSESKGANGYMAGLKSSQKSQCHNDAFSGAFNTADDVPTRSGGAPNATSYAYDSLGRSTLTTQSGNCGSQGFYAPYTGTLQRSFDMENHIIQATLSGYALAGSQCADFQIIASGSATYGWGPNGHPIQIANSIGNPFQGTAGFTASLHWDGDSLLFTSDQNGSVTDVKVGLIGDLLPSGGISVLERDWSGNVVAGHSAAGSLGVSIEDPYQQNIELAYDNGIPDAVAQLGPIIQPASDGIWDGICVIQGVRNHDPQTGTWTTPDAYKGEISDPMSQKSYVWNKNNPISYVDPSGFEVIYRGLEVNRLRAIVNDLRKSSPTFAKIYSGFDGKNNPNLVISGVKGIPTVVKGDTEDGLTMWKHDFWGNRTGAVDMSIRTSKGRNQAALYETIVDEFADIARGNGYDDAEWLQIREQIIREYNKAHQDRVASASSDNEMVNLMAPDTYGLGSDNGAILGTQQWVQRMSRK